MADAHQHQHPQQPPPDLPSPEDFLGAVSKGLPACRRFRTKFADFSVCKMVPHLVIQAIDPELFKVVLGPDEAKRWIPTVDSAYELLRQEYSTVFIDVVRTWNAQRKWWRRFVHEGSGGQLVALETPPPPLPSTTPTTATPSSPLKTPPTPPPVRARQSGLDTKVHRLKSFVVDDSVIDYMQKRAHSSSFVSMNQIMTITLRCGLSPYLSSVQAQAQRRTKKCPQDAHTQPPPRTRTRPIRHVGLKNHLPTHEGRVIIRVPAALAARVRAASTSTGRSVSSIVAGALDRGMRKALAIGATSIRS